MRLGLCTGGGDCPGLNAVIRAVVKHATGGHGIKVLGIPDGLTGLMPVPPKARELAVADVERILEDGGTILGSNNQGSPFRDATEGQRAHTAIQRGWKTLKLDGLIVVGGDGTQYMTRQLVDQGLKIVGIPKTIDNDLDGTELTVGFSTAVDVAAEAACRLRTSADAHDRVMVLEVMGRDAGHIALSAGVAAGANAVLIPEIPFNYDELVARLKRRQALGRSSFLIIVAEGAVPKGKGATVHKAPTGMEVMGGIGDQIARELHRRTGVDSRCTVLGHLQRGGRPNAADRILGSLLGKHAVDLVIAKKFGRLVGVQKGQVFDFSYTKVTETRRLVALKSDLVQTAEALGITLGRKSAYSAPL